MSEDCDLAILVLIGIPGAGKTSFVNAYRQYLDENPQQNLSITHVCYDQLVPLETQKKTVTEPGLWKELRTKIHQTVDHKIYLHTGKTYELDQNEFFDKIEISKRSEEGKKTRALLVIDDNNYLSSMRYPYFQMARKHEIGFCQLHLNTEIQTALRLNENRAEKIPVEVIKNMANSLEAPDPFKNHWEKFSFSLPHSMDIDSGMIQNIVETAFKYPEKPPPDDSEARENDRIVCSANVVHQADKHLRTIINKEMKALKDTNPDKETMKAQSKKYYEAKQEILEDMKTGFLKLEANVVESVAERKPESGKQLLDIMSQLFAEKCSL
eukprot:TRINITY_DN4624_c0_g1_i2.p1 TRINITY_DN4624_c0_g1~~TRINITY_DN4624_c0_g1_i2.p1  ORF type:complete len:335 (-),score=60.79 TRINITY_DN4624_c0_g1_i2:53-1027(-)